MTCSARIRAALAATLLGLPLAALATTTPVFINELHYDDIDTDAGEAIEIAGPVGTDLTGWSIVLYNGSTGATYDTDPLPTPIPDSCNGSADGVVVLNYAVNGIQNGGPDGLALVDPGGNVVQFLSYEGTFTATNGPASGRTSTDINVSEANTTPEGQSLQLTGGPGASYEEFNWTGPATASFGACNAGQGFGAAVDVPPTVASTTPVDNATGVATGSAITIHFSEAVTANGSAVTLQCDAAAQPGTLSGSGADYSFTPAAALPDGASCTVTVHAVDVTDVDDTPDAMAADYVFGFQTLGDIPPTVVSTNPANGTGAFPMAGNLSVLFSEPVSTGSGWYAISCDTSGTHAATQAGSGASYSLNPAANFAALENCTLTIVASAVHDLDGDTDAMAADLVVAFTIGPDSSDYYAGVDTSSGPALEAWLHNRLVTAPPPYTSIVAYPYTGSSTDTWDILSQADQDPANPDNILDLFKNASYAWQGGGQQAYNREHTWPKSLGFPDQTIDDKPNPPYNDTHMLHLADVDYNGQRGNGLLGNCTSTASCTPLWTVANDGFGGDHNAHGDANWKDGDTVFEVWDHRKGDVARAVMYMAVRYDGGFDADGICEPDLQLTDNASLVQITNAQTVTSCSGSANVAYNGLLSDLLQWNLQDPPDDQERLRNDVVFSYQHNRNPFVDHPEWATCVFEDTDCPVEEIIFQDGFDGP